MPDEPLETALAPKFQQLEAFLSKKKYILGEKVNIILQRRFLQKKFHPSQCLRNPNISVLQISYVDFFVYEVLVEFQKFNKEFLKPYPALERYVKDFESLPKLAEYIKASDHLLCYSPFATLQF